MKHTPGPWKINKRAANFIDITGNNKAIASVTLWSLGMSGDELENEANANLISVAPDLLEMCKELITAIEIIDSQDKPSNDDIEYLHMIIDKARNIIAKTKEKTHGKDKD